MSSDDKLDATHKLRLQMANILWSSINLQVNESLQRIGPVCCQCMHTLTLTKDETPTKISQQRYRLWIYQMALVSGTSTLHHIQLCTTMQVLDFIPFSLSNYQFTTPFCWATEHVAYVVQGRLMFQFTTTHAISTFA